MENSVAASGATVSGPFLRSSALTLARLVASPLPQHKEIRETKIQGGVGWDTVPPNGRKEAQSRVNEELFLPGHQDTEELSASCQSLSTQCGVLRPLRVSKTLTEDLKGQSYFHNKQLLTFPQVFNGVFQTPHYAR